MRKSLVLILTLLLLTNQVFAVDIYNNGVNEQLNKIQELQQQLEEAKKSNQEQKVTQAPVVDNSIAQQNAELQARIAALKAQQLQKAEEERIAQENAKHAAYVIQDFNAESVNPGQNQEQVMGTSYQGSWEREDSFWIYIVRDGSGNFSKLTNKFIDWNGNTYYLEPASGHMATSWKYIDRKWYMFDKNGAMLKGWYHDGINWYYLDRNTGVMASSDAYIDGELQHFKSSGEWIKDVNSFESTELAEAVKGLVRWVKDTSSYKKTNPEKELKKNIEEIIESLPRHVLTQLAYNVSNIYIATEQSGKKDYIQRSTYKDEDGERMTDNLPFYASKQNLMVDGSNPFNFYYAIGQYLAKQTKTSGQPIYNTAVWRSMNNRETQDELLSLTGSYGLQFYIGDNITCLSCAIGWFLLDYPQLREANEQVYKYVAQYVDITERSPLIND